MDVESKSLRKLPLKEKFFPGEAAKEIDAKEELKNLNELNWNESLTDVGYYGGRAIEHINHSQELLKHLEKLKNKKENEEELKMQEETIKANLNEGITMLNRSYRQLKQLYELAYKYGNEEDRRVLNQFGSKIKTDAEKIKQNPWAEENIEIKKNIVNEGLETFNKIKTPPELFKLVQDFAKEKSSETYGDIAFETYEKFGNKSPVIAIENSYAGGEFSTGEELKELVERTRENFVKKAVKEGKLSESEARKKAEEMIGATWDVGRMNTLRKFGYDKKELIKETEKIAPLVKHVHLSDNFGFEGTELPMGMGNVPMKEIMEKLGQEGYEGKKAIEAMHWWQHFSPQGSPPNPPLVPTLKAFGSPIYSVEMGPTWGQSLGFQQGYLSGYGNILPEGYVNTWGTGFSQLPSELGGQRQNSGGRMSGRPME